MSRFGSLMDVATAPSGMALEKGLWFTHGVDLQLVADHLSPALVGESLRDVGARRRRAASFEFPDKRRPHLVIVADGRHLIPGPAVPWVRVMPVHGRVQHAKFGVLVFNDLDKSKRRVRAFVSSANLTAGGLSTNHEFLIVEDRAPGTAQPTLAADLVNALHAFLDGTVAKPGDLRGADRHTLMILRRQMQALVGPRAGLVAHSLDGCRQLVPTANGAATRIDIVSPAFAAPADSDVVTKCLDRHLDGSTRVSWYLGSRPDGTVAVPKAAWTALRTAANRAEIKIVGADEKPHRPLHSKLLAFTRDGSVDVVAGSANFTSRGLEGRNRELVVRWRAGGKSFDLLDRLNSVPLEGKPSYTTRAEAPPDERSLPLPVISVEYVEPDEDGSIGGVLRVTDVPRGTRVEVRVGRVWRTVEQLEELVVPLGAALIQVRLTRAGTTTTAMVPVDYSGTRPGIWILSSDRDTEVDSELDSLLSIVRRAAREQRATTTTRAPGSGEAGPSQEDRYLQRLQQPLVLLARYREQLAELEAPQELESALERFDTSLPSEQWNPAIEGRIARHLLGLSTGPASRLLKAMMEVSS